MSMAIHDVPVRWLVFALFAGCAAKPQHTIPIALLVDGDRASLGALSANAVSGLELHEIELPKPRPAAPDPSNAAIAQARSHYATGDFDACRAVLANVDHVRLLAARERGLVARALVLDTACAWGGLDKSAAHASAAQLASFSLAMPELAVSPDVERVIGQAVATAGKAPRSPLFVRGVVGARLLIDGVEAGCTLPCTIDVTPGDHVIAVEADGYEPTAQRLRAPDAHDVTIKQQPANPDLAARQWRARVGRGQPSTDAIGAALVGKLAKQRRVAYLHGDQRLTGALVVDGKLVATANRPPHEGDALVRELAYDGGILHRPALWEKPWFWIGATAATIVIAGAVVWLVYEPDKHTRVVVP